MARRGSLVTCVTLRTSPGDRRHPSRVSWSLLSPSVGPTVTGVVRGTGVAQLGFPGKQRGQARVPRLSPSPAACYRLTGVARRWFPEDQRRLEVQRCPPQGPRVLTWPAAGPRGNGVFTARPPVTSVACCRPPSARRLPEDWGGPPLVSGDRVARHRSPVTAITCRRSPGDRRHRCGRARVFWGLSVPG